MVMFQGLTVQKILGQLGTGLQESELWALCHQAALSLGQELLQLRMEISLLYLN